MAEMTSRERIIRTYKRQETDRMPMVDSAWRGTINRWHKEGLPENVFWEDYFGFDKTAHIGVDNSPRFEQKVLEETDRYKIVTTAWGQTQKHFKKSPCGWLCGGNLLIYMYVDMLLFYDYHSFFRAGAGGCS